MKGKKRISILAVLVCIFALVFSMGLMSACGNTENEASSNQWYYGAEVPADTLGTEGDFYLNTKTLASYKKTSAGWTAVAMDESGEWLYGVGGPKAEQGALNDFYLDTAEGDLYQKTAEGWKNILKLFGKNGRDGILWFSGEGNPNDLEDKTPLKDAIKGDFYLDYSLFVVYQLGEDGKTWNELGTLKGETGESGVVVGWTVGSGAPTAETAVEREGFYLDSESGNIYQKTDEGTWALKGSLGNLSASHIKTIEYNTRYYGKNKWGKSGTILNPTNSIGGSYTTVNGDTSVYGYWFTFDNDTHLFVDAGDCRHLNGYSAEDRFYLYQDDCERGTAYFQKCKFCGEWSLVTTEPTGSEEHPFNEDIWVHNETHHWHPAACSHDVTSDIAEHEYIKYATLAVDEDDTVSPSSYIIWYECTICGYKYRELALEDLKGEDGSIHISTVREWNAYATLYNANKASTIALPRAAGVTVELESDIDFNGASLKPLGSATNPFTGTLKGNSKTLSNFTLTGDHAGLLGVTGEATVQDLTITGAVVTASESGSAGVLAAEATGALMVKNVTVKESEAVKAEGATGATVGGLVGKVTDGSVSVESVEADVVVDGANHNSGQEGNMLVGGSGSVSFTGDNKVGYPVGDDFIEMHYKNAEQTQKIQFEIYSVKGLESFRDSVNGENGLTADNYAGKTVVLMNDLDFNGFDETGNVIEKNIWWSCIGVGSIRNPDAGNSSWNGKTFNGTFDGQEHTIKNICMGYDNLSSSPHNGLYPSLFGGLVNATVKNLKFDNVEAGKSPRSGYNTFGILAKWQNGGTITGIEMNDVEIVGGEFIGLLCGMAHGTISDIHITKAIITGGGRCVGGLVGRGGANFENCTLDDCEMNVRNGYLVGGILGQSMSNGGVGKTMKNVTVKNTHIVCDSSNSNSSYDIGLVVGYLYRAASGTDTFDTVTVENCSVSAKTGSTSLGSFILRNVGGVVGSVGCQFANFSSQGRNGGGDINISFKDVTVKNFTLSSGGTIDHSAGIIGGRSLFKDGGINYGNIALTFEGCSVIGLTMQTGQQFEDNVSITASGYYVGSFVGMSFGGNPLPTNESITFTFTGTNTYEPTVEGLTYCGMEASSYVVNGTEPSSKEEPVG